ncbi:MAG: hypothetical protein OXE96_03950 [Gemmatimonadetes bacterium]|nr:hypothetical protein [Gemmatimonadota bacterium]
MTIDLQFLALLVGGGASIRLGGMLYHRWRGRELPGRPFSLLRAVCLGLVVIAMLIVALGL